MSQVNEIIAQAASDSKFRRLLQENPEKVFAQFDLTESEKELLKSTPWEEEVTYAQDLDNRIEKHWGGIAELLGL